MQLVGSNWPDDDLTAITTLLTSIPAALHRPIRFTKPRKTGPLQPPALAKGFDSLEQFALARELLRQLARDYDREHNVSKTKEWRALSGWKRRLLFWVWADNQDMRGYADAEGLRSPGEDFASSVTAYFLPLDSSVEDSIKCRIPEKYDFIINLFPGHFSPLENPGIQCLRMDDGMLHDIRLYDVNGVEPISMGPIHPDTVEGFEVLYATPGSGDISEVAGHLLLRIKLNNNPRAKELGIENPHDLVISFLADTERDRKRKEHQPLIVQKDCKRNNWFNLIENRAADENPLESIWQSLKGLSGGFFITMDRQSLGEAVKSYTIEQDRDLLRYELILTESMKSNLLERLYLARKNYQPKYYFFSKNCGTVLIRVIGQGIGDAEIADFDPLVSPPHTLLGLMVRKCRASRVAPSFYSASKRGFIAQNIFLSRYRELTDQTPNPAWPLPARFFHHRETVRADTVRQMGTIGLGYPAAYPALYQLATIFQEAEMVHGDKGLVCENYTSRPTTEARQLQEVILAHSPDIKPLRLNMESLIGSTHAPVEISDFNEGSKHTQHYPLKVGAGYYESGDRSSDGFTLTLQGAFLQQEMGSPSSLAMQRAGSLELGTASFIFDDQEVKEWRVTGLRLRKFRDTLNRVPSVFSSTRGLGLGLSALDIEHIESPHKTKATLIGGEILGNIISSRQHKHFLLLAVGTELNYFRYPDHENLGVNIPLSMESLVSFDSAMRWQWRSSATYSISTRRENSDELRAATSIRYRLCEFMNSEWTSGLSMTYRHDYGNGQSDHNSDTWIAHVELHISRW